MGLYGDPIDTMERRAEPTRQEEEEPVVERQYHQILMEGQEYQEQEQHERELAKKRYVSMMYQDDQEWYREQKRWERISGE